MNKKNILTYGLSEQQNHILQQIFGNEDVLDVTDCFDDLIAIPAAAVVINPVMMRERDKETFNEAFQEDFDTAIVFTEEMQDMRFLYTKEENLLSMENTINAIKERLSIPEEHAKAKLYMNEILRRIEAIINPNSDASYMSQVAHMESYAIPYDDLNKLLEHIDELKAKDRYPYRSDLILMLKSVMLAHGIIEEGVFDFDYENGELDKSWVKLISGVAGRQFRNRTLIRRPVYGPIYKKIISWIAYEENKPITEYNYEKEKHDKYRAENDLDCVLQKGNLNADTIFSLWLPLRFALVRINNYRGLKKVTGVKLDKTKEFLERLLVDRNLEKLLPLENRTTRLLSELFVYGQQIENTMLFPDGCRWMQKRGKKPYYDYMPYFLYECFEGGDFSSAFMDDEDLRTWIEREDLGCFFEGEPCKENIIDLAGTGDITNGIPGDLNEMLEQYITILQKRKK